MDAPLENRDLDEAESGAVSLRALTSALGRVPIWLVTWGTVFLLSLVVALPWYFWFADEVGHRYPPGTVSGFLDTVFRTDHEAGLGELNRATSQVGAILAFIAILVGVFFAGGWLQIVLERTRGQSLRRFLYGGARYFWRFFRLLLLSLVVLAFFGWVVYERPFEQVVLGAWLDVPAQGREGLEGLDSAAGAFAVRATQDAIFAILFALTLTWGDYTRTRLALQDTYSAVWGGIMTFFTMLRHPIRTLRPMVVILIAEALVLFALAWLMNWIEQGFLPAEGVEPAGVGRVWILLILLQVGLVCRAIIRGARYHATAAVSHDIVRPLSRPDPWKESIGGPGGPRYPLEEGDEYGVAL